MGVDRTARGLARRVLCVRTGARQPCACAAVGVRVPLWVCSPGLVSDPGRAATLATCRFACLTRAHAAAAPCTPQRAEARAARERAAKAASARRYAEAKQQEIADGESSKLAAEAEGVTSALGAGTDTEPADLVQKVVNAVQLFTGATGVYLGERDEPDNEGETLCVRYSHATEDHKDMLGKTLQVGEGVTFDVWKVPEKTEEEEDAGDEDGEGKVEKPPAFSPVEVRNVLLNSTSKFFRRPAPGAYYAVPIRYKSSLYKGSITDAGTWLCAVLPASCCCRSCAACCSTAADLAAVACGARCSCGGVQRTSRHREGGYCRCGGQEGGGGGRRCRRCCRRRRGC